MQNKLLLLLAASVATLMTAAGQVTLEPGANGVIAMEASRSGMTRIAFDKDRAVSVQKIAEGHPEGDFSAFGDCVS